MTEAYIHQTIHTLDGNVRHLDAHIAAADEASRALFGRPFGAEDATEFTASRNADGQFRVSA